MIDTNTISRSLYEKFYDREVEVLVENRVIHRGFFKSCVEKDFYFIVTLTKRKNERGGIIFLPFPFVVQLDSIEQNVFSYKLSDFSKDAAILAFFKKKINQENLRKYNFFNNTVTIRRTDLTKA